MHVGWVMFWKGIVVALGAVLAERYQAFKEHRRAKGIPLRFDKRRNTYVADDRLERAERTVKRIGLLFFALFIAYGVLVFYLLLA